MVVRLVKAVVIAWLALPLIAPSNTADVPLVEKRLALTPAVAPGEATVVVLVVLQPLEVSAPCLSTNTFSSLILSA